MEFDPSKYYQSHRKLSFVGEGGQQLLQQASVLVIGAGGLGCPCLQYLAGAGVGNIGVADFDTVAITNLHRQVLYDFLDVGKLKSEVAAKKINSYNPGIAVRSHDLLVAEKNILSLIAAYDIIVDCTDNFQVRYLINDACVVLNKPLVYGAIHQTEGHITVFNYKGSATLRCLFPNENNDGIQSCADIGAYNITTGVIGTMMANEVIKVVLNDADILVGKLLQFDAQKGLMHQIKYLASAEGRQKSLDRFNDLPQSIEISPEDLFSKIQRKEIFHLIDVRESEEHHHFNIGGENIVLQNILHQNNFPYSPDQTIVFYCEKGSRSLQAAQYLISKGFSNVFSLQGGINLWQQKVTPINE